LLSPRFGSVTSYCSIELTADEYLKLLASPRWSFTSPDLQFNRNFLGDRWAYQFALERFGPDNLGSLVTLSTGHSEKSMLFFSAQALQALRGEIQMYRAQSNPGIATMLTQLDQLFETLQPDQLAILVDSFWPTQEYE
jgi:hypothetical protein